jgi:hypothetical protein
VDGDYLKTRQSRLPTDSAGFADVRDLPLRTSEHTYLKMLALNDFL